MNAKLPVLSTRKPRFDNMTKAILKKYGVTQQQLADHLGISQTNVNKLLNGDITEPKYSLGVKIVQLYRG